MTIRNRSKILCAVHAVSNKPCAGEVTSVTLVTEHLDSPYPTSLNLCQTHHQLELMVWGIKKFFEVYGLESGIGEGKARSSSTWQEALQTVPDDSRLYFGLPDELEFRLNRLAEESSGSGEDHPRAGFEHLKEVSIDLGDICLTDKQLMAVCMVFYGGVKKKRAAQAMKITSQALSDHIKAALKKIGNTVANS